jgi:oligogalacturonide lyase
MPSWIRLVLIGALCSGLYLPCPAVAGDVGKRFPSEKWTLVDAKTGVTITALTSSAADDIKIYQTHPQWTADGQWIVFHSKRSGMAQAFAVHEASGTIVQLTDDPDIDTGSLNLSRKQNRLFFFRSGRGGPARLMQLDLDPLLREAKPGAAQNPAAGERLIATLPAELQLSGGFALDADEQHAYVGVSRDGQQEHGGICSIDLASGQMAKLLDTPFRMGHVQCNPWVPGEILYCHETGGKAPQRMWLAHAGSAETQPLYKESPDEWVTHEIIAEKDHVLFILSANSPKLHTRPTGMALINLRTQEMQLIGQVPKPGFWHCAATSDLKWAAGDTSTGDLYLINLATGERTLWSTGHRPPGCQPHAHQDFSPDGRRLLFNSGLLGHAHLMTLEVPSKPGEHKN